MTNNHIIGFIAGLIVILIVIFIADINREKYPTSDDPIQSAANERNE